MQNTILIIVPTLNSYKILSNLVNSLKNQSSKSWRLLLIDGESCEEHKKYLNQLEYCNSNISYHEQKDNSGIYGAMNIGLNLRKPNEWTMFWGSDDLAFNNYVIEDLEKIVNKKDTKNIDLIFNDAIYIDKNGLKKRNATFKIILKNLKLSFLLGFSPPHQGCLFSPKILEEFNNYSPEYYLAADLDFFLSVVFAKKINAIYQKKKIVMMSKGGASGKMIKKRLEEVIMIYKKYFGIFFIIPTITRYIIRLIQYANK